MASNLLVLFVVETADREVHGNPGDRPPWFLASGLYQGTGDFVHILKTINSFQLGNNHCTSRYWQICLAQFYIGLIGLLNYCKAN